MQAGPDVAPMVMMVFILLAVFLGLLVTALHILVFCKIFAKAGYSWALGLLVLVPLGNLILVLVLAFANWPVLRELHELRALRNAP